MTQWTPRFALWKDMLKIGLPAGAEFALMAVYLVIVYAVSRPFGAAAQAGFGIGMRIIQACFLPVVALGFAVAPVAGQNFGARRGDARARDLLHGRRHGGGRHDRVRGRGARWQAPRWWRFFSSDPAVIAVGDEYLRIVSWSVRRVGDHLRELEHVPGDGQHDALADLVVRARS